MKRLNTCLFALTLLITSTAALADERILRFDSYIQVSEDGSLLVTETLLVRAEGKKIRRGIYREFPTRYTDRFGNNYRVDFEVISVMRDGQPEAWHSQDMSNGVRTYFGSSERYLSPGTYEYEFVFKTNRQLGFFDTHDELWWNVTGNGWMFPIDRVTSTITLPFEVEAGQLGLALYVGAFGSTETGQDSVVLDGSTVRFRSPRSLQPWEGMSVIVSWPKGLMTPPGFVQKATWFFSDNLGALVMLLGWIAALLWHHRAWKKVGRDPRKGVVIPRFKPPEGLSPAATRYVLDMRFNRHVFTAAVISLAVKGQLTIHEEKKDFSLERVDDPEPSELSAGEEKVLGVLLPSYRSSLELDNEHHEEFQAARFGLEATLKHEYQGRLFNLNREYILPPFIMSGLAAAAAFFIGASPIVWVIFVVATVGLHLFFAYLLQAPTIEGREIMDEIEGFKMYLSTAEQDRLDRMRSPELTPEVFESFLPYAYALGVQNAWCERFARELPQDQAEGVNYQPGWYHGRHRGLGALNHIGNKFSRSFSSAISSAATAPGSSSGGGSSGGGFSGGGGGGGGGGGW